MKEVVYVALIKVDIEDKTSYLLMLTKEETEQTQCVHGFKTLRDGLNYFEESYHRNHARSYEASMSACVHSIFYQPSVVALHGGQKGLEKLIGEKAALVTVRNVAGSIEGVLIPPERAEFLWNAGTRPSLWDERRMNTIWNEEEKEKRLRRYET